MPEKAFEEAAYARLKWQKTRCSASFLGLLGADSIALVRPRLQPIDVTKTGTKKLGRDEEGIRCCLKCKGPFLSWVLAIEYVNHADRGTPTNIGVFHFRSPEDTRLS